MISFSLTNGCHWNNKDVYIFPVPFLGINPIKCEFSPLSYLLIHHYVTISRQMTARTTAKDLWCSIRWLFPRFSFISLPLTKQKRLECLANSLVSFCVPSRYVQHRMEEQRLLLRRLLIHKRASVFVAGNAKQMPDQVTQALRMALMNDDGASTNNSWTLDKANDYITEMIKQSRLQLETWS